MPGTERSLDGRATILFGIGAIVGGAALVLAGPAIVVAGPAALLAVPLNAVLAVLAALSLAELGARFPRSGGAYAFAQQIISIDAAFAVGWLVWFASLAASAVFALGFAEFALAGALEIRAALGATLGPDDGVPLWATRPSAVALALVAIGAYAVMLTRSNRSGGVWLTLAKVGTMGLLGAAGVIAAASVSPDDVVGSFRPFAPGGVLGLAQAMGLLFIAFQGFALVAATAGDVRDPARNLPRAMLIAIAVAAALYLPLFFTIITVGVPAGTSLQAFAALHGATTVAEAARTFLGPAGFWLVTLTAVLAMLTALQANLFAASRIARAMARDRTLPPGLAALAPGGIPRRAVVLSAAVASTIAIALPTIATAGAAAGLIYLAIFALSHLMAFLARLRADAPAPFQAPAFALTASIGGAAALTLVVLNAFAVPAAGALVLVWLVLGGVIYVWLFARQAAAVDAEHEGAHPDLVQLRGRRPLVLVPIANPASAEPLVTVASALAPVRIGRVMLLSVVEHSDVQRGATVRALDPHSAPTADVEAAIENAQRVVRQSLSAAIELELFPEALTTVASDPWDEIGRVARTHDCEILLLGLSQLDDRATLARVDDLIATVRSDVVILRAPAGWHLERVERVLVPFAGRGDQDRLRARLLGALSRLAHPEVEFLRVLPLDTTDASLARLSRTLADTLAGRELGRVMSVCLRSDDPVASVLERSTDVDLVILGLPRRDESRGVLGAMARSLVAALPASCAVLMIHRR
ncbi:MAG: amino acid permease [Trueperaceae bacterium]|nr:amino acid permease [Trueperaceae bacterium]